jgi:hypothetical protein
MAGDWIKVEKATPDKSKIQDIAEMCHVSMDTAFVAWFRVWCWLDGETDTGHLERWTPAKCDYTGRVPGLGHALAAVGWVEFTADGGAIIHNWNQHNGVSAKKRTLTNRRKVQWREREAERIRNARDVPPV